jgi:hypothetical protein
LTVVFDPTSSVTELLTKFKDAIDGQALLQQAYHLQHLGLPEGYFDGSLVIDDFFAVSSLPLFISTMKIIVDTFVVIKRVLAISLRKN